MIDGVKWNFYAVHVFCSPFFLKSFEEKKETGWETRLERWRVAIKMKICRLRGNTTDALDSCVYTTMLTSLNERGEWTTCNGNGGKWDGKKCELYLQNCCMDFQQILRLLWLYLRFCVWFKMGMSSYDYHLKNILKH